MGPQEGPNWCCARQYLAELSEHRDRMRSETLSPPLQAPGLGDIDGGQVRNVC